MLETHSPPLDGLFLFPSPPYLVDLSDYVFRLEGGQKPLVRAELVHHLLDPLLEGWEGLLQVAKLIDQV